MDWSDYRQIAEKCAAEGHGTNDRGYGFCVGGVPLPDGRTVLCYQNYYTNEADPALAGTSLRDLEDTERIRAWLEAEGIDELACAKWPRANGGDGYTRATLIDAPPQLMNLAFHKIEAVLELSRNTDIVGEARWDAPPRLPN